MDLALERAPTIGGLGKLLCLTMETQEQKLPCSMVCLAFPLYYYSKFNKQSQAKICPPCNALGGCW